MSSDTVSLKTIAATALAEHNDLDAAIAAVLQRLEFDADLYRSVTRPLLHAFVRQTVEAAMRDERGQIWAQASPRVDTVRGLQLRAESEFMKWKLRGGLLIAEATGRDLLANVTFYETTAKTNLERAKWLRLIYADLSGPDVKVKDELREADLRRLHKKALKACGDDLRIPDVVADDVQSPPVVAAAV